MNIPNNGNSTANYVWPSGFTPENTSVVPSDPLEPTMRQFMTSPATDVRLISALENQAAYIQGNPGEDEDLELFYYRFVSVPRSIALTAVWRNSSAARYTSYLAQATTAGRSRRVAHDGRAAVRG